VDKGTKRLAWGRLRIAVLVAVCVAAVFAMTATAYAWSYVSEYPAPGDTLYSQPAVVAVDVVGAPVNTRAATITIDGVPVKTFVSQGLNQGQWESVETLVGGVYRTTWTWNPIPNIPGVTKYTLYCYPSTLATGTRNVSAVFKRADSGLQVSPDNWPFILADNLTPPPVTPPANSNAEFNAVCTDCHGAAITDNAMGPDCVSCHANGYKTPTHLAVTSSTPAPESVPMASGHDVGASFGTPKSFFDGTQGVTLTWESEITSASLNQTWSPGGQGPVYAPKTPDHNGAYITAVTAGQEGTLTNTWAFPTVNVFWGSTDPSAPVGAIKGLTSTSNIACTDCHDGTGVTYGPHGAISWGLDPNFPGDYSYAELSKQIATNPAGMKVRSTLDTIAVSATTGLITTDVAHPGLVGTVPYYSGGSETSGGPGSHAVICTKCHDLMNKDLGTAYSAVPTTGNAYGYVLDSRGGIGNSGASNTAHGSHHQDQNDGSPQCVNCHVAIPHAWKAPRLLVDTQLDTAPYRSPNQLGTLRAGNGFDANHWNGLGMESLSAVDNHTLTNGAAIWTEASCDGCNIHTGEDGIRLFHELQPGSETPPGPGE
jgi:hypothetical protein